MREFKERISMRIDNVKALLNEQDIDKLILERFEFMFISNNEIV